jgi:hypothetical protein
MAKNRRSAKATRPNVEARLAQLEQHVEAHQRELDVQLRRMAQIQADLDDIRGA